MSVLPEAKGEPELFHVVYSDGDEEAATLCARGGNYALDAATQCTEGFNPMHRTLQPNVPDAATHVLEAATVCARTSMRARCVRR